MFKIVSVLVLAVLVADTLGQRIIHPTYRPPPRRPIIIRTAREAGNEEPLWLYKGDNIDRAPATGDHPVLPAIIDDVKLDQNRRYARSVDSPSARRSGGSHSTSSGSRDTGATHPGYNRRNAREAKWSPLPPPKFPRPTPFNPNGRRPFPILANTRIARDVSEMEFEMNPENIEFE